MEELTTLQQKILHSLRTTGEWLDDDGLIKITADISESAGTFVQGEGGASKWIPEIEGAYIDVLKPGADAGYEGAKGISKLRRLFNEVRFTLPEGKYDLFADTPQKAALYDRWFKNDPLVKPSGNFGQKLNKQGVKVKYNTLQLDVPESLVQIGNYQDTKRVVFLRPNTQKGITHARMLEEAYSAGGKSTKGLKPYWLQGEELFELEKGGLGKRRLNNPQGWRFKKISTHRSATAAYAMRKRGATPAFEEIYNTLKSNFKGVPDDQLKSFAEIYQAMNKGEIDAMTAQRAISRVKLHGDHSIALSKGGLNWYNNLRNIPARENLVKGASNTAKVFNEAKGISTDRAETILGGLRSPIDRHIGEGVGLLPRTPLGAIVRAAPLLGFPLDVNAAVHSGIDLYKNPDDPLKQTRFAADATSVIAQDPYSGLVSLGTDIYEHREAIGRHIQAKATDNWGLSRLWYKEPENDHTNQPTTTD